MALDLSEIDRVVLDQYLNAILDAFKSGKIVYLEARSELPHTITAAAVDNLGLMAHLRAVLEREAV